MQHVTVTKQELRGEEALRGLREILGVKPSIKARGEEGVCCAVWLFISDC